MKVTKTALKHLEMNPQGLVVKAGKGHLIKRSWIGWLSIHFDGGCSYPSMVESLKAVYQRYGHLVRLGESLTAQGWIARIAECGFCISEEEKVAVLTLMTEEAGSVSALPNVGT